MVQVENNLTSKYITFHEMYTSRQCAKRNDRSKDLIVHAAKKSTADTINAVITPL